MARPALDQDNNKADLASSKVVDSVNNNNLASVNRHLLVVDSDSKINRVVERLPSEEEDLEQNLASEGKC